MYRFVKRIFDFCSSLLLFVVVSPLFFVLVVLVYFDVGKPVFFKQERSGYRGKKFYIIKFRTMSNEKNADGILLPDDQRATKLGRFLRGTSLDELPELLLIIKGDMSVIGPRPLQPECDPLYTDREKLRFNVRGGLIPPEVYFNNTEPTWDEQLEYEASYAEQLSLILDVKIFLSVFKGLFNRYKNDYGDYVRGDLADERRVRSKGD